MSARIDRCEKCGGALVPYRQNVKCLDCGRIFREPVKQEWFSVTQAATYLGVSRTTIHEYIRQGLLKFAIHRGTGRKAFKREWLDGLHVDPEALEKGWDV